MAGRTNIAWTNSTFNPWIGCTKISPGCDNCYALAMNRRWSGGRNWGAGAPRRLTSDAYWHQPELWNLRAQAYGFRHLVFCASQADVFDGEVDPQWRDRLFALIRQTPFLTWQLLTKRIGNAQRMLPADWGGGYPNVWLGSTVVTQDEADRDVPKLLSTPARLRFLSCEPLLGLIDLALAHAKIARVAPEVAIEALKRGTLPLIGWVIVGGESGPSARPFNIEWARNLVAQCRAALVPVFVKQLGANPVLTDLAVLPERQIDEDGTSHWFTLDYIKDKKGADLAEWPAELQAQEFPA